MENCILKYRPGVLGFCRSVENVSGLRSILTYGLVMISLFLAIADHCRLATQALTTVAPAITVARANSIHRSAPLSPGIVCPLFRYITHCSRMPPGCHPVLQSLLGLVTDGHDLPDGVSDAEVASVENRRAERPAARRHGMMRCSSAIGSRPGGGSANRVAVSGREGLTVLPLGNHI